MTDTLEKQGRDMIEPNEVASEAGKHLPGFIGSVVALWRWRRPQSMKGFWVHGLPSVAAGTASASYLGPWIADTTGWSVGGVCFAVGVITILFSDSLIKRVETLIEDWSPKLPFDKK